MCTSNIYKFTDINFYFCEGLVVLELKESTGDDTEHSSDTYKRSFYICHITSIIETNDDYTIVFSNESIKISKGNTSINILREVESIIKAFNDFNQTQWMLYRQASQYNKTSCIEG